MRGEVRLDGEVYAAGLEDREHRGHPIQVALGHDGDDAFAAEPARQQGPCHLIGAAVELLVSPRRISVHGRDGVRMCTNLLLEQFVDPAVRQLPPRSSETMKLKMPLPAGEQALPLMLGIRIAGDQRKRGEVVVGDPGGAVPMDRVGTRPQPQHEPVLTHDIDP